MNSPRRKTPPSHNSSKSVRAPQVAQASGELPAGNLRSFITLAIVLHFTCFAFALLANILPSRLFIRLAETIAPYASFAALDPGANSLFAQPGSIQGDDHFFEITFLPPLDQPERTVPKNKLQIPSAEQAASPSSRRLQTLARDIAGRAAEAFDSVAATRLRGVARFALESNRQTHAVIRCVRQPAIPLDATTPTQPADFTAYEAEIWLDEDGELQIQKRSDAASAAPSTKIEQPSSTGETP